MDLYKDIDLHQLSSYVSSQFDDLAAYHDTIPDVTVHKAEMTNQLMALAGDPSVKLKHTVIRMLMGINEAVMLLKDRSEDEDGNPIIVPADEAVAMCAANNLLNVFHYFNESNNPASLIRNQCVNSKAFAQQDVEYVEALVMSPAGILAVKERRDEAERKAEEEKAAAEAAAAARASITHYHIETPEEVVEVHNPANESVLEW